MINDWLGGMTVENIALKHGATVADVVAFIRAEWECMAW